MSNNHITHLEDLILQGGQAGALRALDYCRDLIDMVQDDDDAWFRNDLTTKWDGAPAIICGRDPQTDRFFIATKHAALAQDQRLAFSEDEIEEQYGGKGDLAEILKRAFRVLAPREWFTILQGDIMWARGTSRQASWEEIGDTIYFSFKPNTVRYGVPLGSHLATEMAPTSLGVVFHTRYVGTRGMWVREMTTYPDVREQVRTLRNFILYDAWIEEARYERRGTLLTTYEARGAEDMIEQGCDLMTPFLDQVALDSDKDMTPGYLWNRYVNSLIRDGAELNGDGFADFVWARFSRRIAAVKTQKAKTRWAMIGADMDAWLHQNTQDWRKFVRLYFTIMSVKDVIVESLNANQAVKTFKEVPDDFGPTRYAATGPEGYVFHDKKRNEVVKLVNRDEFSRNNFTQAKVWK
jgi:hypothetical protein